MKWLVMCVLVVSTSYIRAELVDPSTCDSDTNPTDRSGISARGDVSSDKIALLQDLNNGKSVILANPSGVVTVVEFTFNPPATIEKVQLTTKVADKVNMEFFDASGAKIAVSETSPVPSSSSFETTGFVKNPSTKQNAVAVGVTRVEMTFESSSFEFGLKYAYFFGCTPIEIPPPPPPPVASPPPPPPPPASPIEPCQCRLRGDPILENCNFNLHFLKTGVFELSSSDVASCEYTVRVSNAKDPNTGVIITSWMEITQGTNFIMINRQHEVSVNGGEFKSPPLDLSWVTVTLSGDDFVHAKLKSCEAAFQFWGKHDATRGILLIPGDISAQTTGLCNQDPE